jgi:enoyl-CoA hydratase/carnithine racemase
LEIANNIVKNAPLAVYSAKRAIDEGAYETLHMGLKVEENMYDIVLRSQDREEGLKAFLEKRTPDYKGK